MKPLVCPKGHALPHVIGNVSCGLNYCATRHNKAKKPVELETIAEELTQGKQKPNPAALALKPTQEPLSPTHTQAMAAQKEANALAEAVWDKTHSREDEEETKGLRKAIARYEARKLYTKTPDVKALSPEEIKNLTERKLGELTLDAVSRVEFDLKLGDDDASRKAAYEVLDRTGFGRKDGGNLAGAPIIIVNQGGEGKVYRPSFLTVDADDKEKK